MSTHDTVISTIKGEITGEPLVSIWRHFPDHDLNTERLVEITTKEYRKYPSDVVKLSPNGRYCVVDFGCKIEKGTTEAMSTGSSSCKDCIVKKPQDWDKIEKIDPLDGHYGEQIELVRRISQQITESPLMMTVFVPTMVARKLSNNNLINHLRNSSSEDLKSALKIIEQVTIEFGRACIDAGAHGIFMATQEAEKIVLSSEIEAQNILHYNKQFVEVMNQKSEFTVNHIHGEDIYFHEAIRAISSNAINWHDQTSNIDLDYASRNFKGGLLGGLDPTQVYHGLSPSYFERFKKLRDEMPLILAPGCVLLQQTPESALELIFNEYVKN